MGATEWHHCGCSGTEVWSGLGFPPDYCKRREEYGFPSFVFWHGWILERMGSVVGLVVEGVIEVDNE